MSLFVLLTTWVWVIGSMSAVAYLAWELWQCRLDVVYMDDHGWNGPMHIVVGRDMRMLRLRLSVALSYVLLGLLVLIASGTIFVRLDFTLTMLWSGAALLINSIVDRRGRSYVAFTAGHDEYLPSALRVERIEARKGKTKPSPD